MATEITGVFKDEEFELSVTELDTPNLDGWEFFVESQGVSIYRQYNESSGLYQYKIYGELDVEPEICAQVYMDLEYRKHWDTYAKAFMHYYDNPKGNIPTWLINWAAKTGVPQFLTIMQQACRGYSKYLEPRKER